jgi:hypothetical protein
VPQTSRDIELPSTLVQDERLRRLVESHLTSRLFGQILRRIKRLAWHPT